MPLVSLDLAGCYELSMEGMQHLRGLPLSRLNVCFSAFRGYSYEAIVGLCGDVFPIGCVVTWVDDFVV